MGEIIYIPPEGSVYTGMLSGICYIAGKRVTQEEYRIYCINAALSEVLRRAKEKEEKRGVVSHVHPLWWIFGKGE